MGEAYSLEVNDHQSFGWDFRTVGELLVVLGENDPEEVEIMKNTCLEGTSLVQTASFELSCVRIGWVVWAVDLRKKQKIHTYVHIYTTKNAHLSVIFHHVVGVLFMNRL